MNRTVKFLIILCAAAINTQLFSLQKPAGQVVHKYEDSHGSHKVCYEAYPEGSLQNLITMKNQNKSYARLGAVGFILGIGTTCVFGMHDMFWRERSSSKVAAAGALTIGVGLIGVRSKYRYFRADQTIARHVPTPPFSQQSLQNNHLKNGSFDWFVSSQETTPLQDSVHPKN